MKRLLLVLTFFFYLNSYGQLIINEILYDPSNSGLMGDANGDGVYDQEEDSFIEFINIGQYDYDASGLEIWDDTISGQLRYTVAPGTMVPPNGALVVFGGSTPVGNFGGAIVQAATASAVGLNLNNSGEIVIIKDASGQVILTFDSDALSNNPNESYTRNPDLIGSFEQHNDNTPLLFSPGTYIDGTPFDTVSISAPTPKDITFRADLGQAGVSVSSVFVAGNFNAYCANCDFLTDADGDEIWEGTFTITLDTLQYLIYADGTMESLASAGGCVTSIGGQWSRELIIQSDSVLDPYCWNSCSICLPLANSISVGGTAGQTTISSSGGTLQMLATILPSAANQAVVWSVDDPSLASIGSTGLLTASSNGVVSVTATTIDGTNLSGSADITISNQSIGLDEGILQKLVLYPNPSNGLIHIKGLTDKVNIRVLDLLGNLVYQEDEAQELIDLQFLSNGLYLIELSSEDQRSIRRVKINHF